MWNSTVISPTEFKRYIKELIEQCWVDEYVEAVFGPPVWRIQCFLPDGTPGLDHTWHLPLIDIVGVQAMRLEARQDEKYFVMMTRVRG